ncbi:hypothetical protein [Lelliottia wanjuensis]|uniref:hypothetical protein n=1 Tax=Lelliottia wanjuensis TaxID=3050585 RepID=UPI002550E60D|nr:hypothetical protein [Lelliottia sp. V86_10]MDK9586713.1 hypothetical protein [Lelliottia sp. V86_10]
MRNIWIGLIALALSGCAVIKSESGVNETVALGGACAVNANADSYQVACASSDAAKVIEAIKNIKAGKK